MEAVVNASTAGINASVSFATPDLWQLLIIGVVLIVLAVLLLWFLKNFIVNSVLGIVALVALSFLGLPVQLSIVNVIICGVLGLIGVGAIAILAMFGIHF